MKPYAEREPTAYYVTLKEMQHKLRTAFARGNKELASKLMRDINLYRLQAHTTYGLQLTTAPKPGEMPKNWCDVFKRFCNPTDCQCSPMPEAFRNYEKR